MWRHDLGLTHSAIRKLLKNHGVIISQSTIVNMLIDGMNSLHQEKLDIVSAGMKSSSFQQIDDTGAKVKGKNWYTHILCNPFYTAFFTKPKKNRLTVLEILTQGNMQFIIDDQTLKLMLTFNLGNTQLQRVINHGFPKGTMSNSEIEVQLKMIYPNNKKMKRAKKIIMESAAISCADHLGLLPTILMSDDAPQFKLLAKYAAACWVHDGRHYKKLTPYFTKHQKEIDEFLSKYWSFYRDLLIFTKNPTEQYAIDLETRFDTLFSNHFDYQLLNDRVEKTKCKKDSLLLALRFTDVPLHNNASELGAKKEARNRDVSMHCMSERGRAAMDTGNTIVETARKLGVNISDYFKDRCSKKFAMPSLAEMIGRSDYHPLPT